MKTIRLLAAAIALSTLACPVTSLRAQEAATTATPKAQLPPNLTFDFPGGTLAQLIATLAKAPGGPVNIIGDPDDLKTVLPAFAMQNAHPSIFARALGQFLQSRGLLLEHSGIQMHGSNDVYTLKRFSVPPARSPSRDQFESMQLAPYLEHQKVDDIIAAVRAAWELDAAHDPDALKIKYHPPTTILLVSGPSDAIEIAKKVVTGTLRRTAEISPNPGRLEAVANEVTNRRQERENATPKPAPNPTPSPTKR